MTLSTQARTLLASRVGIVARWLFHFRPRNLSTNLVEEAGFWSGAENVRFTIEGEERDYIGVGGSFGLDPLTSEKGLKVKYQTVRLGMLNKDVEQVVRGYSVAQAPAELHVAFFDPDTGALVHVEEQFWGWVDGDIKRTPVVNGAVSLSLRLASGMRGLTQTLTLKKSHASQTQRQDDQIRKYSSLGNAPADLWNDN